VTEARVSACFDRSIKRRWLEQGRCPAILQKIRCAPAHVARDAVRFAIEELPPELLLAAPLKVADKRFDGDGIRRLYESVGHPLVRCAVSR
jgi:hypothetical protein